jgi:hypothetical protein
MELLAAFFAGGNNVTMENKDAAEFMTLPLMDIQTVSLTETATFALG